MKIGICIDWRNQEQILASAKAKADFVELGFFSFSNATAEEIQALKEQLASLSLPCLSYNLMFPWAGMKVTGKTRDFARIDEYLYSQMEKLQVLDSRNVVFGSGGARALDGDNTREQAYEEMAELLALHVGPIFKQYGFVCTIEALSDAAPLVTTVEDALTLAKMANHPNIKVLVDFYHVMKNGEPLDTILEAPHLLSHVHTASFERHYPTLTDGTDYSSQFAVLKKAGYDGLVSIEAHLNGDFAQCAKESIATLKQFI